TRRAAISGLACDGTVAHLVLAEAGHPTKEKPGPYIQKGGERLFPLKAASFTQMIQKFDLLNESASVSGITDASDQTIKEFTADTGQGQKVVVLLAKSLDVLLREITFMQTRIEEVWDSEKGLLTPAGSCFVPKPLSEHGKIALVYPGSGSAYNGMGTGIFQAFPELHDFISAQVNDVSSAFFSHDLYQRSLVKLDADQKVARELELQTNALPMMASGCTYAVAYTRILQEYLKVKGDSVLGCSMGETSAMLYSQEVWDAHHVDEKFLEAPLFKEWVGGDMKLLAKHWNVSEQEAKDNWLSSLIRLPQGMIGYKALAEWYEAELSDEERVFLTFVHTDKEIIISGHQDDIKRILDKYGIRAVSMKINNVVHHNFCREVMDQLLVMHDLPVKVDKSKAYYSGITGKPMELDQKVLSKNAAEVCCEVINWPFLIDSVYNDGHKIFIELGPNANCTRWTTEILGDREHIAIPSDRKGRTALRSLTGMVAALLANGVEVDLSFFYTSSEEKKKDSKVLMKTLHTGGSRYLEEVLTQENIALFQKATVSQPAIAVTEPVAAEMVLETAGEVAGASSESAPPSPPFNGAGSNGTQEEKLGENGLMLQNYDSPTHLDGKNVIWNEKDLLTFAEGKIADVFGEEYAVIDTYRRRVMLPMPPYLLVSRVTKLNAEIHNFKPSTITTEYDIPYGAFYSTDGQVPWAVGVESGQCDLLLISYLGIDFEARGDYVYRLLDCTLTFLDDLPFEGQTLRYDISINSYVKNDRSLLFFFSYECFVEDRMVLKMDGGCAGFFTDEELSKGQGVVYKNSELEERTNREKNFFHPFLSCDKRTFDKNDLLALVNGDLVTCFGPDYNQEGRNKSLRMPPEGILMLDRITEVDIKGGNSGIGYIEAEMDMQPENWYFPCHFRDDEVLAGSLQAEGGGQLLRFFMLLLGMQKVMKDARFQPVLNIPQKVRCRKEIPPNAKKLIYRMDVKEIGLTPEPYVIADLEIIYDDLIAVHFENLGLRLQEKDNPQYLKPTANLVEGIYVKPVDKPVLLNEYHITQFALGPVHKSFGDEYKVFEGRELSRQPNTDLQFISRVLEVKGERHKFTDTPTIIAEYDVPADAWYYKDNASPVMPYS
ncbi:MAG: PfaB family protein, partial [Flavobacteriales bacterium]|nr:PfaB family protein [Flavobacteriales bacterium]